MLKYFKYSFYTKINIMRYIHKPPMQTNKKLYFFIPELFLIVALIFYWLSAGSPINFVAITLIAILIYQIISKNKILGILIPSLLILPWLYFILALISEVFEFSEFNAEAQKLLFTGLLLFLGTLVTSVAMIRKYASLKK